MSVTRSTSTIENELLIFDDNGVRRAPARAAGSPRSVHHGYHPNGDEILPGTRLEQDLSRAASNIDLDHDLEDPSINPKFGNFSEQVQQAQDRLLELRKEQELMEQRRFELEQLGEKQARFARGRRDLAERLQRGVVSLEREIEESQILAEKMRQVTISFERHSQAIRSLKPESWQKENLHEDLDHALSVIDDAEDTYRKAARSIPALQPSTTSPVLGQADAPSALPGISDPLGWMRIGLYFSAPPMVFGLILFILHLFFRS
jgi:hypothetical protein